MRGTLRQALSNPIEALGNHSLQFPVSLACSNIEAIIKQLVRLSLAIHWAGVQARLERADQSLDPDLYRDFRAYLPTLVMAAVLPQREKEGGILHSPLETPI